MANASKRIFGFKRAFFSAILVVSWASFSHGNLESAHSSLRLEAEDPVDVCFGRTDAPLTIVEYSSLNCPHCAVFHQTIFPQLKKKYIETGRVRFIFRHFPIDHKAFVAALVAARLPIERRAAFITAVFENQGGYFGKDSDDRLSKLAGLEKEEFKACITDQELQNSVLSQRFIAEKVHKVEGAPTFFMEGQKYSGTLPLEAVEKALAQKERPFKT